MWRFSEIRYLPDAAGYWAQKQPDKVALIDGETTRTYAEFERRSNAIANKLATLGIKKGDRIAYVGKNAIEVFEIWFGANKLGAIFAPLNWRLAPNELALVLADATPPVVFVDAANTKVVQEISGKSSSAFQIIECDPTANGGIDGWIAGVSETAPNVKLEGTDTALLSYTSGTTGLPKGVMASFDAFHYSFLCGELEPAMAWRDDDIMLSSMPNFHLAGSWVPVQALYHGATISVLAAFDPQMFLDTLRRDRPTLAPLVPTTIAMLLDHPDRRDDDFACIRSIIYYGSPIGEQLLMRAIKIMDCTFAQSYGATELWFSTILSHEDHLSGKDGRLGSCGKPLPMVLMKILAPDGIELPDGKVGELIVRTPMVMTEYLGNLAATAEVMQENWYSTGDMAWRDSDGFYYIVDRKKDMIITGGENVYSAEVEKVLMKHPDVAMVAVIGLPDEKWGERVSAVVVARPDTSPDAEGLGAFARQHLAGYKIPKTFFFEESLPMNPTGKILKTVLRERFAKAAIA